MDSRLGALVAEHGPGALIATDAAGTVVFWNVAAEGVFGFTAAEATGRPLVDLIVPADQRDDDARMRAEALDRTSDRYEVLRRRKDGVPIYVNCSVRRLADPSGGPTLLLSHMADATRHRARRDAELVQARFQGVLESAPDAIVIVNGTGRIVLFNSQARTLFGYGQAEMIGEPIERLLPQRLRMSHVGQRTGYIGAPRMRAMGEGRELNGLRAQRRGVPGRDQPEPDRHRGRAAGDERDPRHHRAQAIRARAAGEEPRARARQPGQGPLPGDDEPRAAHAAERDHRLHRDSC